MDSTRSCTCAARSTVHGTPESTAAARDGDLDMLIAVLHPDVVLRSDAGSVPRPAHGRPDRRRGR
ncbi:hypothetical protein ACFYO8_03000 [Micromonospora sp. NPDC005257]|uniref:hypothetical protein n=1 Tax=Micromonospora sp. NPDC005257 TaxID=3364230 RepID=UPI0036A6B6D9